MSRYAAAYHAAIEAINELERAASDAGMDLVEMACQVARGDLSEADDIECQPHEG